MKKMRTIADTLTHLEFIRDVLTFFQGLTPGEFGVAFDGCNILLGNQKKRDYYYRFGGTQLVHSPTTGRIGAITQKTSEVETIFHGFESKVYEVNDRDMVPTYTMHYDDSAKSLSMEDIVPGCTRSRKWTNRAGVFSIPVSSWQEWRNTPKGMRSPNMILEISRDVTPEMILATCPEGLLGIPCSIAFPTIYRNQFEGRHRDDYSHRSPRLMGLPACYLLFAPKMNPRKSPLGGLGIKHPEYIMRACHNGTARFDAFVRQMLQGVWNGQYTMVGNTHTPECDQFMRDTWCSPAGIQESTNHTIVELSTPTLSDDEDDTIFTGFWTILDTVQPTPEGGFLATGGKFTLEYKKETKTMHATVVDTPTLDLGEYGKAGGKRINDTTFTEKLDTWLLTVDTALTTIKWFKGIDPNVGTDGWVFRVLQDSTRKVECACFSTIDPTVLEDDANMDNSWIRAALAIPNAFASKAFPECINPACAAGLAYRTSTAVKGDETNLYADGRNLDSTICGGQNCFNTINAKITVPNAILDIQNNNQFCMSGSSDPATPSLTDGIAAEPQPDPPRDRPALRSPLRLSMEKPRVVWVIMGITLVLVGLVLAALCVRHRRRDMGLISGVALLVGSILLGCFRTSSTYFYVHSSHNLTGGVVESVSTTGPPPYCEWFIQCNRIVDTVTDTQLLRRSFSPPASRVEQDGTGFWVLWDLSRKAQAITFQYVGTILTADAGQYRLAPFVLGSMELVDASAYTINTGIVMGVLGPLDSRMTADRRSLYVLGIDTLYAGHPHEAQIRCVFSGEIATVEDERPGSHPLAYTVTQIQQPTTHTLDAVYTFTVPYGHTAPYLSVLVPPARVILQSGMVIEPTLLSVNVRPEDRTTLSLRIPSSSWLGPLQIDRSQRTVAISAAWNRPLVEADHPEELFRLRTGDRLDLPLSASTYSIADSTMILRFAPGTEGDGVTTVEMASTHRGFVEWTDHPQRFTWVTPLSIFIQSALEYGFEYQGTYREASSILTTTTTETSWVDMLDRVASDGTLSFAMVPNAVIELEPDATFVLTVPFYAQSSWLASEDLSMDQMDETIDYILVFGKSTTF